MQWSPVFTQLIANLNYNRTKLGFGGINSVKDEKFRQKMYKGFKNNRFEVHLLKMEKWIDLLSFLFTLLAWRRKRNLLYSLSLFWFHIKNFLFHSFRSIQFDKKQRRNLLINPLKRESLSESFLVSSDFPRVHHLRNLESYRDIFL